MSKFTYLVTVSFFAMLISLSYASLTITTFPTNIVAADMQYWLH